MSENLIIIDGNSLVNRAFYAIPELTDKNGLHTNAIYGFANILFKILEEYKPSHLSVAFDLKGPTFRHNMFKEYKGTRKKMPDELAQQMQPLKEMLEYFGITRLELQGYEADDIVGTVSKHFEEAGIPAFIITGDKDSFQLASHMTKILYTKKGISDLDVIDEDEMLQRYGITPTQFIDLKALMGDTSDNIPGVSGIGEKTGIKLIKEYKSIENLYLHLDEIKGAVHTKLEKDEDMAHLSKSLATICRDIPIDFSVDELLLREMDKDRLTEFFMEHGMLSLVKKITTKADVGEDVFTQEKVEISYTTDVHHLEKNVGQSLYIKVVKGESLVDIPSILSVCIISQDTYYVIARNDIESLKDILEDTKIQKVGWDIKQDYLALLPYGIEMHNLAHDLKVAQYLLDPDKNHYDISEVAVEYGLSPIFSEEKFFGKGKSRLLVNDFTKAQVENYYLQVLTVVKDSQKSVLEKITEEGMLPLYQNVEMKLVKVLGDMEYHGVMIDREELERVREEFAQTISSLEKEIYALAGEEFNINSPKQMGVILFEKLQLPVIKKTKTGYSTNASVLEMLREKHEIIDKITSYRQYAKLQSTYVEGLLNIINPNTHRIHSSFNQTITATGRISSTEPNMQNIPVKLEIGRNLRKAFIAKEGCFLVDSDYSQIELRVLAHISDEEAMIRAFSQDIDIHTQTASEVFSVPLEEVTSEQRSAAKAVNFGIVYGISDFGLSNNLRIAKKKAGEYIQSYLDRYKNIEKYMDTVIKQAEKDGYVTTILERRRYIPQIKQKNFNMKNLGKRLAMNTPIQGSAADIIKIAMVKVHERLTREKLQSKLILQVHDELIIETPEQEKEYVVKLLQEEMQNAYALKVKLKVDIHAGHSWYETK